MKNLQHDIQDIIQNFRDTLPSEVNSMIEQGAGEISSLSIIENALKVGDSVKDFTLNDRQGTPKQLSTYLKNGPVVLTFYRGVWCPYCNLQLKAYNDVIGEINNLGAELIALTPESKLGVSALDESALPQEAKDTIIREVNFDVLYDYKNKIANQFGLVFTLPQSHRDLLSMMEFDVEKANDENSYTFADPATYIIGDDLCIKWCFIPNNYRKRAEPKAILDALAKIQKDEK